MADGKIELLDKMVRRAYEEHAKKNNLTEWKPVLLFINQAKLMEDVDGTETILASYSMTMLHKVIVYKCKAFRGGQNIAEAFIGFGEGV